MGLLQIACLPACLPACCCRRRTLLHTAAHTAAAAAAAASLQWQRGKASWTPAVFFKNRGGVISMKP
jgi:hypothetical protein